MTQSLNSAPQKQKFSVAINSKMYQNLIASTLRDPARARRFTAAITSAVAVNPALQECDAGTILAGALLGESLNLSPSPQLGQYYLVPFKQKAKYDRGGNMIRPETTTATFVLGYKGYIQLALRSGQYKDLDVMVIKQGEYMGKDPETGKAKFQFIEDDDERETLPAIGYMAYFEYLNGFRNEIVCWPMATLGDRKLHMSCIVAGRMAATDTDNAGVPYESPSNKDAKIDGLCLADGTAVVLTFEQANALNGGGIVTALNFMGAWKVWGNYTGCYPSSTDPKDMFIPCGRMFAYVQNTIIRTCWQFLDKPMNRRLLDTITDTVNIWLNGLVGSGYLLGARVEISEDENPVTQLMAGIIKIHVYMTPASPAQEIDFVLEYDSSYVTSALTA